MITSEYYFPSAQGQALIHVNQWTPQSMPVQGVVQIAHGVAEYGMRYEAFAKFLCHYGFVVTAHDHLGHGQSRIPGAPLVYFGEKGGWNYAVEDMHTLRLQLQKVWPQAPHFLFGHSMGSFLTRTYLVRHPGNVKGAILCGTGHPSVWTIAGGKILTAREVRRLGAQGFSEKANRLAFGAYNKPFAPNRTDYDWLSADEANVDAYIADPLCGAPATIGLMRDLMDGLDFFTDQHAIDRMDRRLAAFFISGDKDPVGEMGKGVERAAAAFRKAGLTDVTVKLYHDLRHEILNEKTRRFVYQDILDWLEARL